MAEDTRTQESQLVELGEVPENGKPIGPPIPIKSGGYLLDEDRLEEAIISGANAYLSSGGCWVGEHGYVRAVQFYQIPENP